IWQMQYASTGPDGKSADYMKYSGVPELYAGLSYKSETGFLARAGFSFLSIKPRTTGTDPTTGYTVKVSDRLNAFNPYIYIQYTKKSFEFKAKTIYSQAGDYMNMMSGYGVSEVCSDGSWNYTPNQVSSTWASISYGKKWQFMFMAGYIKNLGTTDKVVDDEYDSLGNLVESHYWYTSNGSANLASMWRIIPTVAYNIGKLTLALEYNLTSARYGDSSSLSDYKLATKGIHPVTNHRIQMMVKFTF
ncbi:MAG: hypothetical protein LUC24_06085, partial [Bacteroidales bacterium]|nr:hypothetical protein [Bacteroidales bacterium]